MANQDEVTDWPAEQIPDLAQLFMRVHKTWSRNGSVSLSAFKNHANGMSTDWEKYSTAHQTRSRAKNPGVNAVVSLDVGSVRNIPGQSVQHTPDREFNNRAHTDVFGEKNEEIRIMLRRLAEIVIPFDAHFSGNEVG